MQRNVGGVAIYLYTHLLRSSQQKLFGMGRKTLQIPLNFVYDHAVRFLKRVL